MPKQYLENPGFDLMSPLYATKKKIQKLSHTPIIVAVPTNEVGIWGGGLALTFKRLFPELPRLQHALMKTHPECMGDTYLQYAYMSNDVLIQAFPTKGKIQSKSSIEKIRRQMVFSLSQKLPKFSAFITLMPKLLPHLSAIRIMSHVLRWLEHILRRFLTKLLNNL